MEKLPNIRTVRLFLSLAKLVAPPPVLKVSEWSDQHRRLSPEASAEPGQWSTDRVPYMRDVMDCVSDDEVETVVIMSSAQVGKTEVELNIIGYHIHQDPSPIMLVQPTEQMAEAFSRDRLATMLRDSPALRDLIKTKSRDGGNTLLYKSFPGGQITLAGANSPASLAGRPIRIILGDEVDRYPDSAGTEGDPVELATKRTTTFFNRKRVLVSTPTIKGSSRIEEFYNESSMEQWCLPCPSCDEPQPLAWPQIQYEYDNETKKCTAVHHACKSCGSLHNEREWKAGEGKWIARTQERQTRGFHLNELASPWKRWSKIVEEYITAKRGGPKKLQVWWNTSLGETWEEHGAAVDSEVLYKRRELYPTSGKLPNDVLVLTAAVDVQDNRLEYEIVGWDIRKGTWGIKYGVVMGDPGKPYVWAMIDQLVVDKTFLREDGQQLQVMTTCVDSGGHHTKKVYTYCKSREFKRVWAIKGKGGTGIPFIIRPKRRNDEGAWLFSVGVDVGKDTIFSDLQVIDPELEGYCHWPDDESSGYDMAYFEGLTSEHRVTRTTKGKPAIHWEKRSAGARNEPFDLRNYNLVAFDILSPPLEKIKELLDAAAQEEEKPATAPPQKRKTGLVSKIE